MLVCVYVSGCEPTPLFLKAPLVQTEQAPPGQIFKVKTGRAHKKLRGGGGVATSVRGEGGRDERRGEKWGRRGVAAAAETSLDTADANTCPYWRHAASKCPATAPQTHTHTRLYTYKKQRESV